MAQTLQKSMVLDGIAASEAIDSSGEILDIKGLDITSLQDGTGVLNYEHRGDQSEGASANDIIGSITFAKKIFGPDDCANDRELSYWNKVQLPFIYIQAELFNDEGHPGAQATAALVRYYQRRKLPILMRYSIEGSTLDRKGNTLKRAVAKRVAATIKPCNRSCVSGVLSDDKDAPEKSKAEFESLIRFENPNRRKLGGYEGEFEPVLVDPLEKMRDALESLREINDLNKAMSIGGVDAAPTSLSGGAALAASDFGPEDEKRKKFIKNQAMAALRDWRGRGDLRKFLKHRLPDTSPDFLEHFAKLVEDYQLKKMIELEDNLIKAVQGKIGAAHQTQPEEQLASVKKEPAKKPARKVASTPNVEAHNAKVEAAQADDDDEDAAPDVGDEPLTLRGRKVRANESLNGSHFDERKGVLYTPRGSFKMYIPQGDELESFHNILNDPKATAFHDYATSNWFKVHNMLKAGTLPPEVIMHSTLFSQLSPNTPVPMQELMYSHLVDSMKDKGIDARSPEFASLKDDWTGRDQPDNYPETGRDYFQGQMRSGVHLKHNSKGSGRVAGQLGSFMLANNKFKGMAQYHELHDSLVDLFKRHGTDARSAVAELMAHKNKDALWEARRKREIAKGRQDPGPYSDGPAVPGLAPKTGRYMAAMIGGGNVHVPDTHFTRYLFGLEKGTDSRSIQYLKNVLWTPNNAHVLDGIDRFYAAHHPAVQHMMQHPKFGQRFQNREDAIFPSFWKNWIAIAPHERARNMKTMAYNEATDHKPFWEALAPYTKSELEKSEPTTELPLRTAMLHADWVKKHGEVPAMMMYYAHIVPQLLRASRKTEDVIVKMNRLADDLRKAGEALQPQLSPLPDTAQPGVHKFKGKHVTPGEIELVAGPYKGSKLHFLGKDNANAWVRSPEDPAAPVNALPLSMKGKTWRVNSAPQEVHVPSYVDGNVHADPLINHSFEQKALAHGIDITDRQSAVKDGMTKGLDATTGWYRNAAGTLGLVKPDVNSEMMWDDADPKYTDAQFRYGLPHREVLFHNMAKEFFGIGQHVPTTALFRHPDTDKLMSVQQRVVGGQHFDHDDDEHGALLHGAHQNGTLDKLALTDILMGNGDRNPGNYMLTSRAPGIHLIDNGLSLDYKSPTSGGYLWSHHHASDPSGTVAGDKHGYFRAIHPAATQWLQGLSPVAFLSHLNAHGVPKEISKEGYKRFRLVQQKALEAQQQGRPFTRMDALSAVNEANGFRNF